MSSKRLNYDFRKLKDKIRGCHFLMAEFADKMGITQQALSNKLNNKSPWSQDQIVLAAELLKISDDHEFRELFFSVNS